jgi:hypothetical protein
MGRFRRKELTGMTDREKRKMKPVALIAALIVLMLSLSLSAPPAWALGATDGSGGYEELLQDSEVIVVGRATGNISSLVDRGIVHSVNTFEVRLWLRGGNVTDEIRIVQAADTPGEPPLATGGQYLLFLNLVSYPETDTMFSIKDGYLGQYLIEDGTLTQVLPADAQNGAASALTSVPATLDEVIHDVEVFDNTGEVPTALPDGTQTGDSGGDGAVAPDAPSGLGHLSLSSTDLLIIIVAGAAAIAVLVVVALLLICARRRAAIAAMQEGWRGGVPVSEDASLPDKLIEVEEPYDD